MTDYESKADNFPHRINIFLAYYVSCDTSDLLKLV